MDAEPQWGAYSPNLFVRIWIALCRRLPPAPPFRRLGIWLKAPVNWRLRGPVDARLWGLRLRLYPHGDLAEACCLFLPQFAERQQRKALAQRLQPGDLFIETGTHAGLFSYWVWSQFGDRVRIEVFEPDPDRDARIRFNLAANSVGSVRLNPFALRETEGIAQVHVATRRRGMNRSVTSANNDKAVPMTTLVAFATKSGIERIDALKIDGQEHEAPVLAHFFAHAPTSLYPRLLICQTPGPGHDAAPLYRVLRQAGYTPLLPKRTNTIFELPLAG